MIPSDPRSSNRHAFRSLPLDLLAVVAFVLLTDALVSTVSVRPVLGVAIGLPVLFLLPGYSLLAALFPEAGSHRAPSGKRSIDFLGGTPSFPTRLALSFGLSVALIPIFGILLALSPVGFGATSLLWLLTASVLVGAVVGTARRMRLPPEERFTVPVASSLHDLAEFVTGGRSRIGIVVNLLLVTSVLLAATGFAFAVFVPPTDANYTGFMLLTRSTDGEFVASGYPTTVTRGQSTELVVGVSNHRDERTPVTVVVELQRVRDRGGTLQVVERSELDRFEATVGPEETWYRLHRVSPDLVGEDLRLVYYLYRGEAPAEPSLETADNHLHIWLDVSLPAGAGPDAPGDSSGPTAAGSNSTTGPSGGSGANGSSGATGPDGSSSPGSSSTPDGSSASGSPGG